MNAEEKELTRKEAINHLQGADSFICMTLKGNDLDVASVVNSNTLAMILLAVMRSRNEFADAVNYAALAYARENIIPKQQPQQNSE